MKSFSRLFTFYLLVLVLTPCWDIHAANVLAANVVASSLSQEDYYPHEQNMDFCTPFCVCNCCGEEIFTPVEDKLLFNKSNGYALDIVLPFSPESSWRSDYLDRLFRPPRV